jgi:hypothetical protein
MHDATMMTSPSSNRKLLSARSGKARAGAVKSPHCTALSFPSTRPLGHGGGAARGPRGASAMPFPVSHRRHGCRVCTWKDSCAEKRPERESGATSASDEVRCRLPRWPPAQLGGEGSKREYPDQRLMRRMSSSGSHHVLPVSASVFTTVKNHKRTNQI